MPVRRFGKEGVMDKKNAIKHPPFLLILVIVLVHEFISLSCTARSPEKTRPNIIFIMVDDLGYGDIGVNGNTVISTPNLDQMADEGINLTRFYSTAPMCSPSRAGALTGRYPIRTLITTALYPTGSPMIPEVSSDIYQGLVGHRR